MSKILLQLILFFTAICRLDAQDRLVTITGKLLDSKSSEPLPFASIYLEGNTIGTVSNVEGSFTFHVPAKFKRDTIIISMIGYTSIRKVVTDFEENERIALEENIFELNEVVVTDEKPPTAKEIVKRAYQSIATNYPSEPYILEGFIRDLQNEDSVYVELLECAIKMRYQSNAVKRVPQIELVELKQSYVTEKHPWNGQWERKNSIIDLVEDDFIRFDYGPIKAKNGWKYEIESIVAFGEKLVYKINAVNKPFYTAQFFIDIESYAFVRIDYSRAARNKRYYKRRLANGQQEKFYNIVFEYQEYNGKWYLKYQKEEDVWEIFKGPQSNELIFTKYPKKELFINKVITEAIDEHLFTNNLSHDKSVESQAKPYNPSFWKYYNFPIQTKEQSKIEEYLREAEIELRE
ncbi:MAG: carboxypeptidase-like regulatory domain-containing protein [Bacteroidota bacterium]